MKIVFLDRKTIGEDISLSGFEAIGEVVTYDFSVPEEVPERIVDADVIIVNKVPVNATTIGMAKNLKLVCVTATGTNNLDKDYLDEKGIAWRNVAGYSTDSVAQHTFATLLYLLEKMSYYDSYVKEERYVNDKMFTHFAEHFHQLSNMTFGIIGLGNIGRKVADIATAFGSDVIYYSPSGAPAQEGYHQVDFDTLLAESDIVSIHAPLNEHTEGLIDKNALAKMKPSAILLNMGRGPIVDETALTEALKNGTIAAAGLDVLSVEPMQPENPLRKIKDSKKLLITPHVAWASIEARTNLMNIILGQVKEFFDK